MQRARKRQRIGDLIGIDAGKRPCVDGQAGAQRDSGGFDMLGQSFRAFCRQTPYLQIAAAGDLQNTVAETRGGSRQRRKLVRRPARAGGRQSHQQPVAGRHRLAQGRAGTASRAHAASSAWACSIKARRSASIELRSGCHKPRRRADKKRSAIARAAAGFWSRINSRTRSSPR